MGNERMMKPGSGHWDRNEGMVARPAPGKTTRVSATYGQMHAGDERSEKDPKNPKLSLPASRPGTKKLTLGTMTWELKAINHSQAQVHIDFKPDKTKISAENVSYAQTVRNQLGKNWVYPGDPMPYGNKKDYQKFEDPKDKCRIDHFASAENDPFYGAAWDPSEGKWHKEQEGLDVGSSTMGKSSCSATMIDCPEEPMAREGKGDTVKEFETCAMVLETREPLGALTWGWKARDKDNAPIELTGGRESDCSDAPSTSLEGALDKFYEAKFDVILDSFASGHADLTAAHKAELDTVVTRLKAKPALTVELGGAADLKEPKPEEVSKKRAEAAKAYLVKKGIDEARISTQSYGADWAKVRTMLGADESKNRRVQVWVRS
jgi:outer membrane protein OmpA-like peptidoglycan-associated protein